MKNSKAKYIKPESKVFYVFAECDVANASKTGGPDGRPEYGGNGDGTGGSGMNGAKQNTGWFNWDDEAEE